MYIYCLFVRLHSKCNRYTVNKFIYWVAQYEQEPNIVDLVDNWYKPPYNHVVKNKYKNKIHYEYDFLTTILWNSMTSTSFVSPRWLIQWSMGEGSYITLFSPSDVTAFHRMKYGRVGCYITLFSPSDVTAFHRINVFLQNRCSHL